jgi:hypothetical protein
MQPPDASAGLIGRKGKQVPTTAAIFLFLAAAVISVFAFVSIVVWVSTPARERQARDRLALLKTLAENPSEQAKQVLDLLRQEDALRHERREREQRKGWITGGLITMAAGVGIGLMLGLVGDRDSWTVALGVSIIPSLIGCVLLGVGLFSHGRVVRPDRETRSK